MNDTSENGMAKRRYGQNLYAAMRGNLGQDTRNPDISARQGLSESETGCRQLSGTRGQEIVLQHVNLQELIQTSDTIEYN